METSTPTYNHCILRVALAAGAVWFCLLLPFPGQASGGLATRLGLVPIAPGGDEADPPTYSREEVSQINFGVFIDPDLAGDAEQYLKERAELCLASYGVQLFERDVRNATTLTNSLLVQADDGTIHLDAAQLSAGVVYGWRVIASLPDGSQVLSSPLYFSVTMSDLPKQLPGTEDPSLSVSEMLDATVLSQEPPAISLPAMVSYLERAAQEQARETAALKSYLAGSLIYETFPTSSDGYVCTPIGNTATLPLPAQSRTEYLPRQLLPLLGTFMQQAESAQTGLRAGVSSSEQIEALVSSLDQLLSSVSYGPTLNRRTPTLSGTLVRLEKARSNQSQAVALLSELRLALDSAIGYGSINLQQDYREAFAAYADMAEERLSRAADWDTLQPVLGNDDATAILDMLNDQRGALLLLREEVAKGRLSKSQLAQRLANNAQRAGQATFRSYETIDNTCKIVGTESPRDSKKFAAERLHCELARLVMSVWGET